MVGLRPCRAVDSDDSISAVLVKTQSMKTTASVRCRSLIRRSDRKQRLRLLMERGRASMHGCKTAVKFDTFTKSWHRTHTSSANVGLPGRRCDLIESALVLCPDLSTSHRSHTRQIRPQSSSCTQSVTPLDYSDRVSYILDVITAAIVAVARQHSHRRASTDASLVASHRPDRCLMAH